MPPEKKPELISFDLCPFVQRSVITLLEKNIEFEVRYIDLSNKPAWFLEISPFGKVPVLKVGETVLFESAVINEYLDEVHPPSLHPTEPLQRAFNRAWIEFGSDLLVRQYRWLNAEDYDQFERRKQRLHQQLARVEDQLGKGPFFNGGRFSLVDAAYAPLFYRFRIAGRHLELDWLSDLTRLREWGNALLDRQSVKASVIPDYADRMIERAKKSETYLAGVL